MKDDSNKTQDNIEVEIRAILDEIQAKALLASLDASKAEYKGEEKLIDLYFCKNEVKEFSEIEMNEVGTYSLRLREKENKNLKVTDLNIKVITTFGDHNAWEEHETEVSSFKESYTILQTLGFKPFFKLQKTRKSYYLKDTNMTVILDNIYDFGLATEIEIITSQNNSENAKQIIKDYLTKVGVKPDQIVPKSITNFLMNKKARFDRTINL